jgi:hypothetical protein
MTDEVAFETGGAGDLGGDDFSRNPSDYRPDRSGHFRRRCNERDIPGAVIQKAIESGDVTGHDNNRGRVKLETTYLGYDFALILDYENGVAVTAFPLDDW